MAQRSVTITHLRYSKKHARGDDKYLNVSELPGGGDLLEFIHGVWRGMKPRRLWDEAKQVHCDRSVEEPPLARGRTIVLTASVGTYGDPSSIRDVTTGKEELPNVDGRLSNAVAVRIVVLVPKDEISALLYIEHVSGVPSRVGARFIDALKEAWAQYYGDYTLHSESLTRTVAWLETANLSRVSARLYGHSSDAADSDVPAVIGDVHVALQPSRGQKYFRKGLLKALLDHKISRAKLLGLEEEPESVSVTLGDGDQQKTFVLGEERTPIVKTLVTDYGTPMKTTSELRAWCVDDCTTYFGDVGARWETGWNKGKWNDKVLKQKVTVTSDGQAGGAAGSR